MKEIEQLLKITKSLKEQYKGKLNFPLDGRLVGDIGEALVSEAFDIELYGKNSYEYDGYHKASDKKVQIKSSMSYNFNYPFNKDLEHFIAVHIESDGNLEVLYNGPGKPIHDFLKGRKRKTYKDIWYTISASHLRNLNGRVIEQNKIQRIK